MKGTGPDRAGDGHSWIAPKYFIAATAIRGWSPRSWRSGQSADTADKARTARLQGGATRWQDVASAACVLQKQSLLVSPAALDFPLQPSGPCFVRSVRALSASP